MADNLIANPGAGGATFRTDDLGGAPAVHVAAAKILLGGDGVDGGFIPGDGTNGVDVDVTRLPSLVAGTANIGDVDVASIAAGDTTIGRVKITDGVDVATVDGNGNLGAVPFGGASGLGANVLASSPTSTTNGLVTREVGSTTDNAAFTDGTTPVIPAGFIFDEVAGVALTENDAAAARIDSKRAIVNVIEDATTRGQRATVTAANALKVDGSAVTQPISGTVTVTEPVSVDDNAGSLTVDAPVGTPVNVQIGDATNTATIRNLAANDALNVAIVDGAGGHITSFGGGTQYTEDVAAAADPIGTAAILVRKDTPATITDVDGDNVAQRGTNYGAAYCQIVTSGGAFVDTFGGSGGTAQADESAFTEGATNFTPIGGVLNDTITSDPTEDQAAAARITAKRAIHTNLRNVAGTEIGTVAAPVNVQISDGTDTALISGTGQLNVILANTSTVQGTKNNNAASPGANNFGTLPAVANAAAPTWTEGNQVALSVDLAGATRVAGTVSANLNAGTNNIGDVDVLSIAAGDNNIGNVDVVTLPALVAGTANIGDVDIASGPTGSSALQVQGTAAHDAATVGNPALIGAQMETMADSAPGTRSNADGDATKIATSDGMVFTLNTGPQTWTYHSNGSTALTDASVHAAPGAGLSLYVLSVSCSSGAATAMNIFFEEGATTILGPWYLEAVAGRGLHITFPGGRKITANTARTVTSSAAIAHSVDVTGFIAPG